MCTLIKTFDVCFLIPQITGLMSELFLASTLYVIEILSWYLSIHVFVQLVELFVI